MNSKIDFINGDTKKCLLSMTLPMIVAMFLNMAYNLVDSLWILYTITSCCLGTLNGLGKPTRSMILMIFYYIVIRIPLAYIFASLGSDLTGIWFAILISHIIACIASVVCVIGSMKIKES